MNTQIPLLLPLNRPQYVPSSETLISSLAWEVLESEAGHGANSGRRYMATGARADDVAQSRPVDSDALIAFAQALVKGGLVGEAGHYELIAEGVLNSVAGVRPTKAKSRAASPMTPGLALLQDAVGMTGLRNPVNYASILETMFLLGSDEKTGSPSMARRWLGAALRRRETDPLLRIIDDAFIDAYGNYSPKDQPLPPETLRGLLPNSPFGWLHDAWVKLTSDQWVDALPPRVWVDWATTVLRMGMAFGFLWEAERYRMMVQLAAEGKDGPTQVLTEPPELLPWPASYLPVSTRSVRPAMRRRIDEGGQLRVLIADELKRTQDESGDWVGSDAFLGQAREALNDPSRPSSLKNVYETVFYSLVRRDESDHYGLLVRQTTNYTLVQPGTEWVAMIAGLSADGPGRPTYVGKIIAQLSRLGLRPPLPELVKLLEAAGLARGSADADHGVRVANPYEGDR
ncbi:hypothetical protein GCM10025789_06600 [Tessaracoccus lubricantis]|uniref:Uncharacterized protein n=1 Tax=Tessaracoccus lubricantis TaxID=545543 RepID=A0ABP9F570_9ACTN